MFSTIPPILATGQLWWTRRRDFFDFLKSLPFAFCKEVKFFFIGPDAAELQSPHPANDAESTLSENESLITQPAPSVTSDKDHSMVLVGRQVLPDPIMQRVSTVPCSRVSRRTPMLVYFKP